MPKVETIRTRRLIMMANKILVKESPMTLRQLFYRLVSAEQLENTHADYRRVSRIMTIARGDGRIDWDAIVDRSRPEYSPNVWTDPEAYAETIQRSYRKDYWNTQGTYNEIWVEKDAVIGSIQALTDKLGVKVRVGRGFQSTTRVHEIAEYFDGIRKPIYVFYLGDHDPSGREIEIDLEVRVRNQLSRIREDGEEIVLSRLAIHSEDIRRFALPPLRIKPADPRAGQFLVKHGSKCVELDALPPNELRRRIRKAVMKHVDKDSWERSKRVEAAEKRCIVDFAKTMHNLSVDI